jgi:hypothetical protein
MYSYEIAKLLKLRYNLVSIREYIQIVSSPQVDHVKYENDEFKVWTNDGYTFSLKIKKNHNK